MTQPRYTTPPSLEAREQAQRDFIDEHNDGELPARSFDVRKLLEKTAAMLRVLDRKYEGRAFTPEARTTYKMLHGQVLELTRSLDLAVRFEGLSSSHPLPCRQPGEANLSGAGPGLCKF